MSVEFTNPGSAQYLDFGSLSAIVGVQTKTVSLWVLPDDISSDSTQGMFLIRGSGGTDENFRVNLALQEVQFNATWSGGVAAWKTGNVITSAGVWYHIVVSYDAGSTSNNPVIYVNGASKSLTETASPSGTWHASTGSSVYIPHSLSTFALDGKLADVRVYDTILSAAQVLALYNDGPFTPNYDTDLVFHAPLTKSTALSGSSFDGYTLTSSQKLVDRIGCAEGTPSGSPLGSNTNPS